MRRVAEKELLKPHAMLTLNLVSRTGRVAASQALNLFLFGSQVTTEEIRKRNAPTHDFGEIDGLARLQQHRELAHLTAQIVMFDPELVLHQILHCASQHTCIGENFLTSIYRKAVLVPAAGLVCGGWRRGIGYPKVPSAKIRRKPHAQILSGVVSALQQLEKISMTSRIGDRVQSVDATCLSAEGVSDSKSAVIY